jgi:hypothetical protein
MHMTLQELKDLVEEARTTKPTSPQMDVTELCATLRVTPPVVSKWATSGAPVDPTGKTDLFGLFEWLHVNQDHPHMLAADKVLVAKWKITRNA